jgi:DNA-binding NarL/FixJ family response regulator
LQQENAMLINTKSILSSRTIWANIVGLFAFLLSATGISISAIDQNALVTAILSVITGGSFIASSYFRIKAEQKLK